MAVFKRRWRKNGKTTVSRTYYGWLRDAQGKRHRVRLSPDKHTSEVVLAKRKERVELEKVGISNPYERWENQSLAKHLTEYRAILGARNDTPKHTMMTVGRIRHVLEGCGFERIRDLEGSRIETYLEERRRQGMGFVTSNHYLTALKGFFRWLVGERRMADNPLAGVRALKTGDHLRHERRALTDDEARALVAAAQKGPTVLGVPGPLRALTYRLALTTGLRRNEIKSLAWDSFGLDSEQPTVAVGAAYSKHREPDVVPLVGETAAALREWRQEHPGDGPVFPLPEKTSRMLRVDLKAAGIPYQDKAGRKADFHALRTTFITSMARSGVHPAVMKDLARHKTAALTLGTYTRLRMHDLRGGLDALPKLDAPAKQTRQERGRA